MQVRLLLGAAGSGKTFRCLTEIRRALSASAEGLPLVLVAPRQTTYQLERQVLSDAGLAGYTRLQVLSFERLAHFMFDQLGQSAIEMVDEEGRLMVLRGLLARRRDELTLFRASARLGGFARELSAVFSEFQRHQLTPESLAALAARLPDNPSLAGKLQDLAILLGDYLDWLEARHLQDADGLLSAAAEAVMQSPKSEAPFASDFGLWISELWVDGFVEWSAQELEFLAALVPHCGQMTLTLCLDQVPGDGVTWLSAWSAARKAFEESKKRFGAVAGAEVRVEVLPRKPERGRFPGNPVLQHLERYWMDPRPYGLSAGRDGSERRVAGAAGRRSRLEDREPGGETRGEPLGKTLRAAVCTDPEGEVRLAAHEILRYVRGGGRYREVSVLVRNLEGYHASLRRVLTRYGIPFFLDRRESVAHHPLAELTRNALRTVAHGWQHEDWFGALKTGLVAATEEEIDGLENEALARGWRGTVWQHPLLVRDHPRSAEEQARFRQLETQLEEVRRRIVPPFQRLEVALTLSQSRPAGRQLTAALREFWKGLDVEQRLQDWAEAEPAAPGFQVPSAVHATVWQQMNGWLENVDLAFPGEALPLREWLPILEAGLSNLSVGMIPPALDQVVIGAIDRSRNPETKLGLVLGLNETVFPARLESGVLLTDGDRSDLQRRDVRLGLTPRQRLARERYYAYLACTRARERLVCTCARHGANGVPLNPSPFLSQLQRLFPALEVESIPGVLDWRQSEHASELISLLLRVRRVEARVKGTGAEAESAGGSPVEGQRWALPPGWDGLAGLPPLAEVIEGLGCLRSPDPEEAVAPMLAERLYGPVLYTSVSRMERFAACPFKFFVHSGLRAEERKEFELDVREQGSFQHDVLALFHQELSREGKRWRDITPREARERVGRIGGALQASYGQGLLQASEQTRFLGRILTESLQDFVETITEWMRTQYEFDPVQVELPFGEGAGAPAWEIDLGGGHGLALRGRIDRVDVWREEGSDEGLCVVVDYKSGQRRLDPLLIENGLQLQLLGYLSVLRRWPNPRELFGVERLVPAGVFYVSLRGKYSRQANRGEALVDTVQMRKLAYGHSGRFDSRILRRLDARPEARKGDQFNYRLKQDGQINRSCSDPMEPTRFRQLLDSVETNLTRMGREVFAGQAAVAPYRKGRSTACDQCEYQAICRIDPWTHRYRMLRKEERSEEMAE